MGEPAAADPMSIPDFSLLTSPDHKAVGKTNHVRASYKLLNDNLLDLSHVGYVHQSTIGNPEMTEKGSLSVKRQPHGVQVRRVVPDVPPPPTYVKTGVLPEGRRIDRWQVIEFTAPCFVRIHVGGAEAGTGALDGVYEHGLNLWIMNAMTPETPHSTHYFWASVRAHALEDPAADHLLFSQIGDAFEEDARVLEAQQLVLLDRADDWNLALQSDAGSIQARRMLDRLIAEEQATSATAAATVAAR
jgi:vanillate O-demethylase monooxygenase subunit